MKKIIIEQSFFFLFLFLFFLVGCNGAPPINQPPVITSTPVIYATVNVSYTYDVQATDPDGDSLTYALAISPQGMTINSTTGLISWIPTPVQEADTSVTVEVTDGAYEDSQSFVITFQALPVVNPVYNITQGTSYTTIQSALNAAISGDIIEVNDGLYPENITLPSGKVIVLESVNGPAVTHIEGLAGSATITCGGSQAGTEIIGFHISHSSGTDRPGVSNTNGSIKITGCNIDGNISTQPGGGIRNYKATLTIFGSNISGNSATTSGGGILNDQGTLNIDGAIVISNNSTDYGGGICNFHGTLTITGGSTISENFAANVGGGIDNFEGTLTITGSTISENSADLNGGGINIYPEALPTIHIIGGNSIINYINFNNFINNEKGCTISADQHIRSENSGDVHGNYPYNYYTPG
jgi:hypothetical protein